VASPLAPPPRELARATLVAAAIAAIVLVVAVLPAEYGLDPTGLGRVTGFARLSDAHGGPTVEAGGPRIVSAVDARWEVVESVVATRAGENRGAFTTERETFPLNLTNLTKLTARLDWWDNDTIDGARTKPDVFELALVAPDGREARTVQGANGADGHGNLSTSLAWRSVPQPAAAGDRYALPLLAPDASSHGTWTVVVRLQSAGGVEGAATPDPGNAWRLTLAAETFDLILDAREGGDRVSFTLAPNEGLEYKFGMQPNATLRYAWTATGPVYWDLHAEEHGHDHEASTRFAEGTSAGERGAVTATFSGLHGWFFQNRGASPVTIALETSGAYTIVGVP